MPDILIRDIPESVLISLDTKAARLGLSRSEYLRRQLAWAAAIGQGTTRVADWAQFSERFADLGDPAVMENAWH